MNTRTARFSRIEDAELFYELVSVFMGCYTVKMTMADGTTYVTWVPQS